VGGHTGKRAAKAAREKEAARAQLLEVAAARKAEQEGGGSRAEAETAALGTQLSKLGKRCAAAAAPPAGSCVTEPGVPRAQAALNGPPFLPRCLWCGGDVQRRGNTGGRGLHVCVHQAPVGAPRAVRQLCGGVQGGMGVRLEVGGGAERW
jgi:hypothetical protein